MKKPQPLGLVVEGKLTNSVLLRLPSVLAELGPVKARTPRLARRATNFLRAGTPIETYEQLQDAQLILIQVPDSAVRATIEEIAQAPLEFSGKLFILCDTWLGSDSLRPLLERGASTATCLAIPTSRSRWFVIEGLPAATRPLRRLLDYEPHHPVEIPAGRKHLLFAAELLAGVLPMLLLAHAEDALRRALLSGHQLRTLLDGIAQRMLQEATHTHRPLGGPHVRGCPPEIASSHLQALEEQQPELARYLSQQIASAWGSKVWPPSAKLK